MTFYRAAVHWIAENDEPDSFCANEISYLVSVQLVADVCGVDALRVATAVVRYRARRRIALVRQNQAVT